MLFHHHKRESGAIEMQIAPMADIGFLLLCFFIVTAKPQKQEADISMSLPGSVSDEMSVDIPEDLTIQIAANHQILVNDQVLADAQETEMLALRKMLQQFREAADSNHTKSMITVNAHDQSQHQRIVDVLAICHSAGVKQVTLQADEESEDELVAGL